MPVLVKNEVVWDIFLLNKNKNITQTTNTKNCEYCYFAAMCGREKGE